MSGLNKLFSLYISIAGRWKPADPVCSWPLGPTFTQFPTILPRRDLLLCNYSIFDKIFT